MSGFWKFTSNYATRVNKILEKPDFTLEELLDESETISELVASNARLVEYLREPEVLDLLVDYVIKDEDIFAQNHIQDNDDDDDETQNREQENSESEIDGTAATEENSNSRSSEDDTSATTNTNTTNSFEETETSQTKAITLKEDADREISGPCTTLEDKSKTDEDEQEDKVSMNLRKKKNR
ncbi:unnamed protein product [Ambrosiozyma monospora]|uniref:Unnamed protein product n=1 Tax=Ambrosiozyma monospora TaxID=43982 RepID=A0ACB5U5P6_AMBMO|nr:unnamed protein product [Ambrosiozyma monospora]